MSNAKTPSRNLNIPETVIAKKESEAKPESSQTSGAKAKAVVKPVKAVAAKVKVTKSVPEVEKTALSKASVSANTRSTKEGKETKEKKTASKKPKLVRDSFTFPLDDYKKIAELKQRALKAGLEIKKSELLRAALVVLSALSDAEFIKVLGSLDKLKPGRPAK